MALLPCRWPGRAESMCAAWLGSGLGLGLGLGFGFGFGLELGLGLGLGLGLVSPSWPFATH